MEINLFVTKFKEQFKLLDENDIVNSNTEFQKIDGWDSLTSLNGLKSIIPFYIMSDMKTEQMLQFINYSGN